MAVTGIGTYASYTNSYGNTQNAGNKTGRTYKNAHEYKNYLTQKYDCLRSRDYSVNINSSLLSKAMGDEKTKLWLEYNLSLIPESIEKLKAAQSARGCKVLSVTDTINGYDSITEEVLVTDEVDPGTEKARKELEERKADQDKKMLTIEEAMAGIQAGKLQMEGIPLLEFDSYIMPVKNIPFIIFKNFYDANQEDEEGVIFLRREKEISQIVSWPKTILKPTTFEQWGNLLVNGMAANRIHADIKKKQQLKHIEYICYEVPSGKGAVYNLMFRFRDKEHTAIGNYNCMGIDKDTFGIIFEAMMAMLDQWTDTSTREAQNGENETME